MFCNNCGKQLPDGVKFCSGCGNVIEAAAPTASPVAGVATAATEAVTGAVDSIEGIVKNKQKNTLIGIVAVAAVVLIAIIILIGNLFFGSNPEKITKKILEATYEANGEELMDFIYKDAIIEIMDEWYGYDEDEFDDFIDDYVTEGLEYDVEYIADTIGEDEEKILKFAEFDIDDADMFDEDDDEYESLEDYYDDYADVKIKGACSVDYEVKFEGEDDEYEDEGTFYFVKIGSKWYADMNY